jgi:hypothetical protein
MRSRLESLLAGAVGAIAVAIVALLFFQPAEAAYIPVPSGAILYFNATTCPTGWAEFTSARGAYIVGRVSGGTLNTLVGTALTNQENRNHTHTTPQTDFTQITPTGLTLLALQSTQPLRLYFAFAGAWNFLTGTATTTPDTGIATAGMTTSNQSTTIAPYLQLLVCKKN